ncbi:MAG: ATP-binding protein [Pseudomonadota bacterium]
MSATWLWWSSGKDSAWALKQLRGDTDNPVTALITTVNAKADRVAMHAVRRTLLLAQAESLGLPVHVVELPWPCSNNDYEAAVAPWLQRARQEGVTHMAFGDLFLEDVRAYRVALLEGSGIAPRFPLWRLPTDELAASMVASGIEAYLTCVDPKALPPEIVGRRYDASLLREFPKGVDPCGENGEFHTFVANGPGFAQRVAVRLGERVERDGFWFADFVAAAS